MNILDCMNRVTPSRTNRLLAPHQKQIRQLTRLALTFIVVFTALVFWLS